MNALAVNCMPIPSPELMSRFEGSGPCYTSYPTADRFVDASTADHIRQALAQRQNCAAAWPSIHAVRRR